MANADRRRAKALEMHVGQMFGGRRRYSGEKLEFDDCVGLDGQLLWLGIEAKAGYEKPKLIAKWLEQAKRNAGDRPWMLVQRPKYSKTIYATLDLDTVYWLAQKAGLVPEVEA